MRGLGTRRGRPLGQAQKASGPWNLPGWGLTRPAENIFQTPKMFVLATFREHWRGRPRRTGAGGPGSLDSASLGPQTLLGGYPPHLQKPKMCVFGRFSEKIGRVAPRTGRGGPGSLDSASLGPQTPLGVPFQAFQDTPKKQK